MSAKCKSNRTQRRWRKATRNSSKAAACRDARPARTKKNADGWKWWCYCLVMALNSFFFFLLLPFIVFCFVAYRHKRVVRRQFYAAEHCKSRVGCALFTIQSTHTQTHRTYPTLHHIHRRQRHKRSATSHFCFFLVFPRKAEEYT